MVGIHTFPQKTQYISSLLSIGIAGLYFYLGEDKKASQYQFNFFLYFQMDRFLSGMISIIFFYVLSEGPNFIIRACTMTIQFIFCFVFTIKDQSDPESITIAIISIILFVDYQYIIERAKKLDFLESKAYQEDNEVYSRILRVFPQELLITKYNEEEQKLEFLECNNIAKLNFELKNDDNSCQQLCKNIWYKKYVQQNDKNQKEQTEKDKKSSQKKQLIQRNLYDAMIKTCIQEIKVRKEEESLREQMEQLMIQQENEKLLEKKEQNKEQLYKEQENQQKTEKPFDLEIQKDEGTIADKTKKLEDKKIQNQQNQELINEQEEERLQNLYDENKLQFKRNDCKLIKYNQTNDIILNKIPLEVKLKTFYSDISHDIYSIAFLNKYVKPEPKKDKSDQQLKTFFKQFFYDKKSENFDKISDLFYLEFHNFYTENKLMQKNDKEDESIYKLMLENKLFSEHTTTSLKLIFQVQSYAFFYSSVFNSNKLQIDEDKMQTVDLFKQLQFFKMIYQKDLDYKNVQVLIEKTLNNQEVMAAEQGQNFSISCIKKWIDIILFNLFHNIVKFTETIGIITINASLKEKKIEIILQNDSQKIIREEKEKLFTKEYGNMRIKMGHKIIKKMSELLFSNTGNFSFSENENENSVTVKFTIDYKSSIFHKFIQKQQSLLNEFNDQFPKKQKQEKISEYNKDFSMENYINLPNSSLRKNSNNKNEFKDFQQYEAIDFIKQQNSNPDIYKKYSQYQFDTDNPFNVGLENQANQINQEEDDNDDNQSFRNDILNLSEIEGDDDDDGDASKKQKLDIVKGQGLVLELNPEMKNNNTFLMKKTTLKKGNNKQNSKINLEAKEPNELKINSKLQQEVLQDDLKRENNNESDNDTYKIQKQKIENDKIQYNGDSNSTLVPRNENQFYIQQQQQQ